MNAKFDQLYDPFNTSVLDLATWDTFPVDHEPFCSGGNLNLVTQDGEGVGVISKSFYDLSNSAIALETQTMLPDGTGSNIAAFQLTSDIGGALVGITKEGSDIRFEYTTDGVTFNTVVSVAYDPVAHKYWRVHGNAITGAVYADFSYDGQVWTLFGSAIPGFSLTALKVSLLVTHWRAEDQATWLIDKIGVLPELPYSPFHQTPATVDPGPLGDFLWKGLNWKRRSESESGGPSHSGQWSVDNVSSPDGSEHVTLKITNPTGDSPICAEMYTTREGFGYGTYTIVVGTNVRDMHPNLVFGGLFLYDNNQLAYKSHNEIDICESSKWGHDDTLVQLDNTYFVDNAPGATTGNSILVKQTEVPDFAPLTHQLIWSEGSLVFKTWIGTDITGEPWRYGRIEGDTVTVPAKEVIDINLWDFEAAGSDIPDGYEVVLYDFSFVPVVPAEVLAVGESVVLDPPEMSENTEFDITPFVGPNGPDWGDAAIQQYLADAGVEGQVPIDFTIPNRTITIPLVLLDRGGISFNDARTFFQQKAALFMEQGGWIKRQTTQGEWFAEVVNAQLKLGGSTMQAIQDVDTDGVLTLTTLPPWLSIEKSLGTMVGVGEVDFLSDAPIEGDHAGRVRIRIEESSGQDQLGVLWAVRARNLIDPGTGQVAATNQIAYEAEDLLTGVGGSSVQTLAGASGPANQVMKNTSVPATTDAWNPTWQEVLKTTLANGRDMTHVGSQRIWVRAYIEGGTADTLSTTRLRFRSEVGDLLLGSANGPTEILKYGDFYIVDLGVIRIDRSPPGQHRWQGYVEAMNMNGTDDVSIDKLWVIPVQEGAGALRSLDPTVLYDGRSVSDAVVFANMNAELRSDGLWRLSQSGAGYGPIQRPQGPLPKLPASGMEQRKVQVFVKTSRGTLDERNADVAVDPLAIEIIYQASHLFVG